MKPVTEDELIAYQLGELPWPQRARLRYRLERDPALAANAEEVAATLRLFANAPAPVPSAEITERSWQRVRAAMPVPGPATRPASRRPFWLGATAGAFATGALTLVIALHSTHVVTAPRNLDASGDTASPLSTASTKSWSHTLLAELHAHTSPARAPQQYNNRPGPLTVAPADAVAEDPALAQHLDTAERVLTEVSHTEGPLPEGTRAQVHHLLLENAVYHHAAEQHGDPATAAVIDDLGRVLITLDAEPAHGQPNPDAFRLQMNLGGVLLDLRILHHNDAPKRDQ